MKYHDTEARPNFNAGAAVTAAVVAADRARDARDRWLRRIADDAIDAAERRALRARIIDAEHELLLAACEIVRRASA